MNNRLACWTDGLHLSPKSRPFITLFTKRVEVGVPSVLKVLETTITTKGLNWNIAPHKGEIGPAWLSLSPGDENGLVIGALLIVQTL